MKSTTEDIELECYSHQFLKYEGKKRKKRKIWRKSILRSLSAPPLQCFKCESWLMLYTSYLGAVDTCCLRH